MNARTGAVYAPEVLQQPMRRVCARLAERGVELGSCRALEFFAREGDWQTVSYADKVARLDAWEIDSSFEPALRRNLPRAAVRIGDSFALSRLPEFAGQFDFIVYDNPQMTFGDRNQYCEHFEALETLPRLMQERAVAIFNVNREPFNYELFPQWQKRRNRFYQRTDTAKLDDGSLLAFYAAYFAARRLTTRDAFIEPRHEAHAAYFVAVLMKGAA